MVRVAVSKKKAAGILLLAIAIPLGIYFGLTGGAIFGGLPAGPPAAYAQGYAQIHIRDGRTSDEIGCSSVNLIFAANETLWKNDIVTMTTFYVSTGTPDGCLFYAEVSGYYPVSDALFASGGEDQASPRMNTVNMFKRPAAADVSVHLLKWQDLSDNSYHYTNTLPTTDGDYKFWIGISISAAVEDTTIFGVTVGVPDYALSPSSIAHTKDLPLQSLWFGWAADTVSNYHVIDSSWPFEEVVDIGVSNLKVTINPACWYDTTYVVQGHFHGLTSLIIFDGLVDNYVSPVATILPPP